MAGPPPMRVTSIASPPPAETFHVSQRPSLDQLGASSLAGRSTLKELTLGSLRMRERNPGICTEADSADKEQKRSRYLSHKLYFSVNRVSCENTHCHRPSCFTKTSVARSCVVKSCPINLPLVVVSPVARAISLYMRTLISSDSIISGSRHLT